MKLEVPTRRGYSKRRSVSDSVRHLRRLIPRVSSFVSAEKFFKKKLVLAVLAVIVIIKIIKIKLFWLLPLLVMIAANASVTSHL